MLFKFILDVEKYVNEYKKDRVFISYKKHLENIEFNMYKNIKTNSLDSFFG